MGIVARGIANVPLLVCDPQVWRTHPELFHYTGRAAFEGIVGSNSFWATHFLDLKGDPTEIVGLRTALPPAIAARYDEIVANFKTNRVGRRLWKKSGRGLGTARDFVDSLYSRPSYPALVPINVRCSPIATIRRLRSFCPRWANFCARNRSKRLSEHAVSRLAKSI